MKRDFDINCNGLSFVFIDTMLWFDMQKNEELSLAVGNWLKKENVEPILHWNLLAELFHSPKTFDFEKLWALIEDHCFSNFDPVTMIMEEIHMIFKTNEIVIDEFLKDAVFKLSDENKLLHKKEYFENSKHFRHYKENKGVVTEAYLKGLIKFTPNATSGKVRDLISMISEGSYNIFKSEFSANLNKIISESIKVKDNSRFDISDKTGKRIIAHFNEDQCKTTIKHVQEIINSGLYTFDELLDTDINEYLSAISHLEVLKMTFEGSYPDHIWPSFINKLKHYKLDAFPGYHIQTVISKKVRQSESKLKVSDTTDFMNLTYLPYVKFYVTDAHIASTLIQYDEKYSTKVLSTKQFKRLIN